MKVILSAVFGALLATAASSDTRYVGAPSGATVIDGPGTVYRTVSHLGFGSKVNVLETYQGYALIARPGAANAWVTASSLSRSAPRRTVAPVPRDVEPYASVVWTQTGPLNMRSGPGLGHDVLSQCQRGDWVEVFAKAGEWAKVRMVTGEEGWVNTAYLTR